ncbi:MAG TPA: c-type cytochrome [Terriglobales bacterium]|jgi:mono/diheme cytochrome c family protein|nr:c-type cytochrome [Terriglobales bacterium]HET7752005.1 c-type cytochrome [Terriglobales bacterium]HET7871344.1 c-type cytochrome [Terriglobales bacterium]
MALRTTVLIGSAVTVLICAFAFVPAQSQNNTESPTVVAVDGSEIFRHHCAVCHGKDAHGRGPAAIALKERVPDLTDIARRNAGVFPASRVKAVIEGTEEPGSHGSREMPIWGPIFHNFQWDRDLGEVRMQNVINYIRSIQQK